MQRPLQITFRDMPLTPALEQHIRRRAKKLDRVCHRITACHVVVESPRRRNGKGRVFRVCVTVNVPGEELVVSRETGLDEAHESFFVAIRDAFEAMTRQLDAYSRRQRPEARGRGSRPPKLAAALAFGY